MNEKPNLVERIQRMMKPTEVKSEEYYRHHLTNKDPVYLKQFIFNLAKGVETPITVIAVGNSLYSDSYLNGLTYKHSDNPSAGFNMGYTNISLFIAPEVITPRRNLRTEISAALRNLEYEFSFKEFPSAEDKRKTEVLVNTKLNNGTPIELLLGYDDIITMTARHVIEYNRKRKNDFSVLYSDKK